MRRTGADLEEETLQALLDALAEVGLDAGQFNGVGRGPDAVLEIDGRRLVVEVKSVLRANEAGQVVEKSRGLGTPLLLASERIASSARDALKAAGVSYFDRRGRLRLVMPGVFVDVDLQQVPALRPTEATPLAGEVAKEATIILLTDPEARPGIREIARAINRAPSTVSTALERLRASGLVTSANEPVVPDLFWELEGSWHREPVALATVPEPEEPKRTDSLQLGLGRRDASGWVLEPIGWALTDTLAAASWGMPVVASPSYPPDFYVPSAAVLNRAVSLLGRAQRTDDRACTVSIAPVPLVCRMRLNRDGEVWPVANHVVVALDLARDRARGREILERWSPHWIVRVW